MVPPTDTDLEDEGLDDIGDGEKLKSSKVPYFLSFMPCKCYLYSSSLDISSCHAIKGVDVEFYLLLMFHINKYFRQNLSDNVAFVEACQ